MIAKCKYFLNKTKNIFRQQTLMVVAPAPAWMHLPLFWHGLEQMPPSQLRPWKPAGHWQRPGAVQVPPFIHCHQHHCDGNHEGMLWCVCGK